MPEDENLVQTLTQRTADAGRRFSDTRDVVLAAPAPSVSSEGWAASPEHSDATVSAKTGRGWDEWVDLIDAGPGRHAGHAKIASWVADEQGVDPWWAQSVTVGYERITGLRLPGQMPDGTFSVSRSTSLPFDWAQIRTVLDDPSARSALIPAMVSTERSRPGAKAPRYSLTDPTTDTSLGVVQFRGEPTTSGCKLVVTHDKVPHLQAAEAWKQFWAAWLQDLGSAEPRASGE